MRTFRIFLTAVALLSCWAVIVVSEALAQNPAPQRPMLPKGFVAEYDVKYVPDGDAAQALDIYYPESPAEKPLPLLIWIHGGGWQGGSKTQMPYLNQLSRGYVTASIEYRFSQKAKFPAQIQDCQAALRWLRANAKKYSIDPERIGVGGGSAGGHLAALVGTLGEDKEKCDAVSPVHYVSKNNPPFLILHGDHDTLVPYAQSVELSGLLAKAGVEVTLQRLPGAGHGGPAFGLPSVVQLATSFFDKHLKGVDVKIEALPESEVTIKSPAAPAPK